MGLGLSNGGSGDFLPLVSYDARAGRLFRIDREQTINGWANNKVDITAGNPTFALDMGTIEVGWLAFGPTGPDFKLAPLGRPMPERPSKEHKTGFRVRVAGNAVGGLREWSSSSKCVLGVIDELHTAYEDAPEAADGKIPLVTLSGTTPITSKGPQGTTTNYAPVLQITGWVDRLPDMGERTTPMPRASATAPRTPTSQHAPPPPAAAPLQQAAPAGMPF